MHLFFAGTILLYELLERLQIELDFFVLYSSITSLGNIGQSSYSAANTFLDNFAGYIAYVVGKRCLSVNWGALRIGELERNETVARQLETDGHGLLDPQKGNLLTFSILVSPEGRIEKFSVMIHQKNLRQIILPIFHP